MGCDIHMWAEVKKINKWEKVGKVFTDRYYDATREEQVNKEIGAGKTEQPYHERNYNLFAILADVRNGGGFAGCKTSEGFNIIDEPRGVPTDASKEYEKEAESWGIDGHSHSYFTLAELEAFNWDQGIVLYGVVNEEEFTEVVDGKPKNWAGDVFGQDIIKISVEQMRDLIAGKMERLPGKEYVTQISWKHTYRDAVGKVWFNAIEELKKLEPDPNSIRVVFFFDN